MKSKEKEKDKDKNKKSKKPLKYEIVNQSSILENDPLTKLSFDN